MNKRFAILLVFGLFAVLFLSEAAASLIAMILSFAVMIYMLMDSSRKKSVPPKTYRQQTGEEYFLDKD